MAQKLNHDNRLNGLCYRYSDPDRLTRTNSYAIDTLHWSSSSSSSDQSQRQMKEPLRYKDDDPNYKSTASENESDENDSDESSYNNSIGGKGKAKTSSSTSSVHRRMLPPRRRTKTDYFIGSQFSTQQKKQPGQSNDGTTNRSKWKSSEANRKASTTTVEGKTTVAFKTTSVAAHSSSDGSNDDSDLENVIGHFHCQTKTQEKPKPQQFLGLGYRRTFDRNRTNTYNKRTDTSATTASAVRGRRTSHYIPNHGKDHHNNDDSSDDGSFFGRLDRKQKNVNAANSKSRSTIASGGIRRNREQETQIDLSPRLSQRDQNSPFASRNETKQQKEVSRNARETYPAKEKDEEEVENSVFSRQQQRRQISSTKLVGSKEHASVEGNKKRPASPSSIIDLCDSSCDESSRLLPDDIEEEKEKSTRTAPANTTLNTIAKPIVARGDESSESSHSLHMHGESIKEADDDDNGDRHKKKDSVPSLISFAVTRKEEQMVHKDLPPTYKHNPKLSTSFPTNFSTKTTTKTTEATKPGSTPSFAKAGGVEDTSLPSLMSRHSASSCENTVAIAAASKTTTRTACIDPYYPSSMKRRADDLGTPTIGVTSFPCASKHVDQQHSLQSPSNRAVTADSDGKPHATQRSRPSLLKTKRTATMGGRSSPFSSNRFFKQQTLQLTPRRAASVDSNDKSDASQRSHHGITDHNGNNVGAVSASAIRDSSTVLPYPQSSKRKETTMATSGSGSSPSSSIDGHQQCSLKSLSKRRRIADSGGKPHASQCLQRTHKGAARSDNAFATAATRTPSNDSINSLTRKEETQTTVLAARSGASLANPIEPNGSVSPALAAANSSSALQKHAPSTEEEANRMLQQALAESSRKAAAEERARRELHLTEEERLFIQPLDRGRMLDFYEFVNAFSSKEREIQLRLQDIEAGSLVRGGNDGRKHALKYGRIEWKAMEKVRQAAIIKKNEKFIDVGSGLGNTVFQMACTVGCDSVGIEIDQERHDLAQILKLHIDEWYDQQKTNGVNEIIHKGNIKLIRGDFSEPDNFHRITEADVVYVNNAEAIFAQDIEKGGSLDDKLCSLFARMKPGSRMISFYQMIPLGLSDDECRKQFMERRKTQPQKSTFAAGADRPHPTFFSFFDKKMIHLGKGAASWGKGQDMSIFCYTRISTPDEGDPNGTTARWTCAECFSSLEAVVVDKSAVSSSESWPFQLQIEHCPCGFKRRTLRLVGAKSS